MLIECPSVMAEIWAIVADEMSDDEWRHYFNNFCDLN